MPTPIPSPTPTPQPERRRRPRALADFSIELVVGTRALPAQLRDLSELGVRCLCAEALARSTAVMVTFCLPGSIERLALPGSVVRCTSTGTSGPKFAIGVQFRDLLPVPRAQLRGYVARARPAP